MEKEEGAVFDSLPNEIKLHIFAQLPEKTIGIAECVCKDWRHLLQEPTLQDYKNSAKFLKKLPLANNEDSHAYRIALIGPGCSGKSAFILRYVRDIFTYRVDPTVEDSYLHEVEIQGVHVKLDIADTAGVEEYRALADQYAVHAQGLIVLYSVMSTTSLEAAIKRLKEVIRMFESRGPMVPFLLVANKVDKDSEDERVCSKEEGLRAAAELEALIQGPKISCGCNCYWEASAKDGTNVNEVFEEMVVHIDAWRKRFSMPQPTKNNNKNKKRCSLA